MSGALAGRRIVLGVTGGVAAYKAAELCRELVRRGAFVSPVLTRGAEQFIRAATFSALASEPARTSLWESPEPSPHTVLGQAADLVVVAPATAHVLAAARAGLSEDLLTTTLLATRAPVLMCPAMHTEMWEHAATVENVATLQARGVHFVMPEEGELAGGDVGAGRLADPQRIADACVALLGEERAEAPPRDDLAGLRVLVSAGGTREPLDPVRYIGNRSSGRQGHAVAAAALARGATVDLVTTTGPTAPLGDTSRLEVARVETAQELHDAMLDRSSRADVVVMAAAVADFRPVRAADRKLKRQQGLPPVELEPTPDVLAAIVAARPTGQTVVGFAAETDDVDANARGKLREKGVDLVVANDVSRPGVGFEHPTNEVAIHTLDRPDPERVELASKRAVADRILDAVLRVRAAGPPPA